MIVFKSTKEFEAAVYEILIKIRDGSDYMRYQGKYGQGKFGDALEHAINRGYIRGVTAQRTAAGNLNIDGNPRLTYNGLSFIEDHESHNS
jgi:hypothetical protein